MKKDPKNQLWKKEKKTFKSVTLEVLESIFYAIDGTVMHNFDRYTAYNAMRRVNSSYKPSRCSKMIYSLEHEGYLKRVQKGSDQESFQFTGKAKMKIVDKISASMEISSHYHFLSFDIPEILRCQRNKFRQVIKRMGFVQIQQSLWVINRDVGGLVEEIAYDLGIEKYVVYIISAVTDIDDVIKKKLELK